MRTLFPGLLAAGLFATAPLALAQQCARPAEKTAFDTVGLKSQLMVVALACNAQDKYNAFVTRYRSDLVREDRMVTGYFGRSYGKRGQKEHDDYVTSLANVQSEAGTKLGSTFCDKSVGLFDQVMALPSGSELPTFASGRNIEQPMTLVTCPETTTPTRTASRETVRKRR